jgi:hypothetical protein
MPTMKNFVRSWALSGSAHDGERAALLGMVVANPIQNIQAEVHTISRLVVLGEKIFQNVQN